MQLAYDQLAALAAVVREGSFERAARALHVTPSAVSQRIKQLEESVGGIVVIRGTPCLPTELGSTIYRHALQVELLENDLLRTLGQEQTGSPSLPAPITVAANADSLATWLVPALAHFVKETGVRVEIVADDQDHTAAWLRSGRVLGAITGEARPVQGCRVTALGVMRYRATATRGFVRRWFKGGVGARALGAAPVLSFDRRDQLQERFVRQVLGQKAVELRFHYVPSPGAYLEATLLGLGWGLNPEPLLRAHPKRGRLVDPFAGATLDVPLYWQQWRLSSPSLDALAAALASHAACSLRAIS